MKSARGNKIVQTYAFLDTGSTSTFCSASLMRKLHLNGRKTNICLLTMSPKTTVSSFVVSNLEISSLDGNHFYELPEVYTQKQMPVNQANMVNQEDLTKWPYLGASCSKHLILIKMIRIWKSHFFPIQDEVIHLTFMLVFQRNIGLDNSDPDTQFSRSPNPDKWDNISQRGLPAM